MNDPNTLIPMQGFASDESTQYLTFSALDIQLGINITDVKEIIEIGYITRVPMSNPCIRGVINLRGNVVPVVDLSCRLGGKQSELSNRSCIVLVELNSGEEWQTLGMLIDEVNEIIDIPGKNEQKVPDFGIEIRSDFINRMGRIDDQFVVLLNIEKLLSIEELAILTEKAGKQDILALSVTADQEAETS